MTVTVGNIYGVRDDGGLEQYTPPTVTQVTGPSVGAEQTISEGEALPAGTWQIVSGAFEATEDSVVRPVAVS